MTTIYAKPNEPIDSLLKRFKKAVERSGVLSDLKKKEYYEKPSAKKKRKRAAARKRALKQAKIAARSNRSRSGASFKWNEDRTKKIYNMGRPQYNRGGGPNNRSNNKSNNRPNNRANNEANPSNKTSGGFNRIQTRNRPNKNRT